MGRLRVDRGSRTNCGWSPTRWPGSHLLLTEAPHGLDLPVFADEFGDVEVWVARVVERDGSSQWLEEVAMLARESLTRCAGTAVVHLDLRDDNILIDDRGRVWICDWNWPLRGAPWLDLVTLLCLRPPGMAWMLMRCSRPIR